MPKIGLMYKFKVPGKETEFIGELVKETPNNYHMKIKGKNTVKVVPKEVLKGRRAVRGGSVEQASRRASAASAERAKKQAEKFKAGKYKKSLKQFVKEGGTAEEYKII